MFYFWVGVGWFLVMSNIVSWLWWFGLGGMVGAGRVPFFEWFLNGEISRAPWFLWR